MIHTGVLLFEIITEHSLWLIVPCILLGLLYAAVLYFKNKRVQEMPAFIRILLFTFRSLLISLLAFFLLSPLIKSLHTEYEKPFILIARDNSSSVVAGKDSAFIKQELDLSLKKMAEKWGDKYELKWYCFGSSLKEQETPDYSDKESDYSLLLQEVENNYENRNLGAIILLGDGLYNKGNNPVYGSNKIKCPLYAIALGDTSPVKDVAIKKIEHNQVVYLGNKFPVQVNVDVKQIKSYNGTISISEEGKKIAEQPLNFNGGSVLGNASFILEADKPGVRKYTVQVTYADGEMNKANNVSSFVIDVIDNRDKILFLYDAPHPDVKAISESIESNQNYEVELMQLNEFNASVKPYSLVILHHVNMSMPQSKKLVTDINATAVSWLLITNLENDRVPGMNFMGSGNRQTDVEALVDKNFPLFTLSEEFKNFVSSFPALKCPLGTYSLSNASQTMIYQRIGVVETENPILFFGNTNEQKNAVFIGDGWWKWKLRDFAEHQNHNLFNELIGKTVQYLSVKADKSFFRVYTKKIVNENENIEFNAEVYNTSYELIADPEVSLEMTNKEGRKFNYTFSKSEKSYRLNAGLFAPGEYSYKAQVKVGDKVYVQKGSVTVKELMAEKMNTVADHQLLYQLAKRTGGQLFKANELATLEQIIQKQENIKTISYVHKELSDLIELKWIFFLLLALLTIEWFMRKRNGLY